MHITPAFVRMHADTIRFRNKPIRSWSDEFQINVNACREEDFINA